MPGPLLTGNVNHRGLTIPIDQFKPLLKTRIFNHVGIALLHDEDRHAWGHVRGQVTVELHPILAGDIGLELSVRQIGRPNRAEHSICPSRIRPASLRFREW